MQSNDQLIHNWLTTAILPVNRAGKAINMARCGCSSFLFLLSGFWWSYFLLQLQLSAVSLVILFKPASFKVTGNCTVLSIKVKFIFPLVTTVNRMQWSSLSSTVSPQSLLQLSFTPLLASEQQRDLTTVILGTLYTIFCFVKLYFLAAHIFFFFSNALTMKTFLT